MPDGTIAAIIYNKPSHGATEGEVDCYTSKDGGITWKFTGRPLEHDPETAPQHAAVGLSHDGSLIVLLSGYSGKNLRENILPIVVCRSQDGGETWERNGSIVLPEGITDLYPFGKVVIADDKTLIGTIYAWDIEENGIGGQSRSYLFYSYDDGRTWGNPTIIGESGHKPGEYGLYSNFSETRVLPLRPERWLAVTRRSTGGNNSDLELLISENKGKTWKVPDNMVGWGITGYLEHPGHLLKLNDGRILLTYGIRWSERGIGARISNDEGRTWGPPMIVFQYGYEMKDWGGYPSSVQLEDGTIVTVYYDGANRLHSTYYMGALRWRVPEK